MSSTLSPAASRSSVPVISIRVYLKVGRPPHTPTARTTRPAAPGRSPVRTFNDVPRYTPFGPDYSDRVIAAMPLKPGYQAVLSGIAPFNQGEPEVRWDVNVVGRDSLETAGAWRNCWQVEQRVMYGDGTVVTLWVDQKKRRLWQKSGAPAGSGLTWFHRVTNP